MRRIAIALVLMALCVNVVAQTVGEISKSIINIDGESYYVHTVKAGETLYSLSKTYVVSEKDITKNNPQTVEGLNVGQVVKIPVKFESQPKLSAKKQRQTFTIHTVNKGETAYYISKRYGLSIATLIEDNPEFNPTQLSIGQQVNIRRESMGEVSSEQAENQWRQYSDDLNKFSDDFEHHLVVKGETMYSLSKHYNTPIDSLTKYNQAELKDGLKLGSILKIPIAKTPVTSKIEDAERAAMGAGADQDTPAKIKHIEPNQEVINVAMLLPMNVNGTNNRSFAEFYQGALIALNELKSNGISSNIDLYNTGRSTDRVKDLMGQRELSKADLIIGPVYDDCFSVVADFARKHGIPAVSPLSSIEKESNSLIYQVSPVASHKYDKLKSVLMPENNVIVISTGTNDAEFKNEIEPLLPHDVKRINYSRDMSPLAIENVLSDTKENIFVILSSHENTVDQILARISSIQNNIIARSMRSMVIRVVGNSRWARFQNIDKNLFFKLNMMYVTSYQSDRSSSKVVDFDAKYINAYSSFPSLYSYRGYEVTMLFVEAINRYGSDFARHISDETITILQSPYKFKQSRPGAKFENQEWSLVNYNYDYTVDVK